MEPTPRTELKMKMSPIRTIFPLALFVWLFSSNPEVKAQGDDEHAVITLEAIFRTYQERGYLRDRSFFRFMSHFCPFPSAPDRNVRILSSFGRRCARTVPSFQ